ncbi:MAG: hypothetical protein J5720_01280 [Bacteroidaceae bacterium]|nr:hypothetical protein [Bacteroidaceae bacterium]
MFDIFKKKSSENNGGEKKLSESEIEQLKQELEEKKEEFRSVYSKYIEAGGTELPDDMLDIVNGGGRMTYPSMNGNGQEKRYIEISDGSVSLLPKPTPAPVNTGGDRLG